MIYTGSDAQQTSPTRSTALSRTSASALGHALQIKLGGSKYLHLPNYRPLLGEKTQ